MSAPDAGTAGRHRVTGSAARLDLPGCQAGPGNPAIMAVVNRSTDSFYVSSASTAAAVAAARAAWEAGATIVDIGGVRAGRGPAVSASQEIDLVAPIVAAVGAELPELVISVDTWRAEVGAAVIDAGALIINDTWAGYDPELTRVAAAGGCALVCSHTGGLDPRTDAHRNRYGLASPDFARALDTGLAALVERARAAGMPDERIIVDPTPDFGKNTYQSLQVMRELPRLSAGAHAVLLAISRKDFVGESVGVDTPAQRLPATLAATALAIEAGVGLIRTHDVAATRQVIDMVLAITGARPPRRALRGLV
ncbi:dihydropteroate synthase [Brevibacterium sp. 50QC2O2]|uniref:dihydropteroate synthase n=1 Tax=Brevibacterium TaxID=1696 RepID=UPI00211C407E|nr:MULTISPECIES: dihydropteroate synthase [unclassified Brevibacterium]MCQ9384744.1 dihydropteroate synthase [Brevibacterium sp. 68QC2CO]MCQ9387507.1 dihydropteroate synthase [Brevibacterium sp. 50QC2O2]